MTLQRAHYIDLIRGVCVLGIIFIHTCHHSGSAYVPLWLRSISLLLDVPAFFFVTGLTMAYIKKDMIINSLFKLSMVFTLLSLICNLLNRHFSGSALMESLFLNGMRLPEFYKGVLWSYWFIPVYAIALILSTIIIKKFPQKILTFVILFLIPYILLFIGFPSHIEQKLQLMVFGSPIRTILFPSALVLLSYWVQNNFLESSASKAIKAPKIIMGGGK